MASPDPLHDQHVSEHMLWPRHAPEYEKHRKEGLHITIAIIATAHVALVVGLVVWLLPEIDFVVPGGLFDPSALAFPYSLVALLSIPVLLAAALRQSSATRQPAKDRIILTPEDLTYHSSRPAWLCRLLSLNWTVTWLDMTSVSLQAPPHPLETGSALRSTELVLNTGNKKRKVKPFDWVDVTNTQPTSIPTLDQRLRQGTEEQVRDLFQATPILSHMTALGLPFDIDQMIVNLHSATIPQPQAFQFKFDASGKTAVAVGAAVIVYLCVAYALLPDIELVGSGINKSLMIVKIALATVVFFWPTSPRMKLIQRFQVVALSWFVIELTSFPIVLHLNQLTSFDTMQPYTYVLQEDQHLRSIDNPDLPAIKGKKAYWEHCAIGSTHTLHLQKGGLGLYMLNQQWLEQQIESNPCP